MTTVLTKFAFWLAIGYSAAQPDNMIDNGMRSENDRSKNLVFTDIAHALIDLFQLLADASVDAMDVYELRLDIWSASLDNELNNPSEVDQARVQKDINRISSGVEKTVTDKNKFLKDADMLQYHVAVLFENDEMAGEGNYDAILDLQKETIKVLTTSISELEDAKANLEGLTDFSQISAELDNLEDVLMKLMDALSNKIVSLQALMNEFGDWQTMSMPLPYVSSLYRLRARPALTNFNYNNNNFNYNNNYNYNNFNNR